MQVEKEVEECVIKDEAVVDERFMLNGYVVTVDG